MQLKVTGMTYAHCAAAVTRTVKEVSAGHDVSVDLDQGLVTVTGPADEQAVRTAIAEEGYTVAA